MMQDGGADDGDHTTLAPGETISVHVGHDCGNTAKSDTAETISIHVGQNCGATLLQPRLFPYMSAATVETQ